MTRQSHPILALAALLTSVLVSPDAAASTCSGDTWTVAQGEWSEWDTITYVYPLSSGTAFTMSHACSEKGTCNGGRQFIINPDDANYDAKTRVLMAAFLSGRQIRVFVDDTDPTSGCFIHIDRLMVR